MYLARARAMELLLLLLQRVPQHEPKIIGQEKMHQIDQKQWSLDNWD